ncbi:MAG: class I SAM-dependent methyltransferase [Candidatus Hydrogenedentes bacterium]|nr:class I SAM-dependent methyltransferase [Candidatus Hydrogenedentota bacterium]
MPIPAHWSSRYVFDKACVLAWQALRPDAPWLTRASVKMLEAWLQPTYTGLEWGAGRSTVWLAARVGALTSVEHNAEWHRRVQEQLVRFGADHVKLVLEPLDSPAYVEIVQQSPDASLDFVLVDGRRRDECALAALPKLKPGGWFILDNAQRYIPHTSRSPETLGPDAAPASERWTRFLDRIDNWPCTWTSSGVADTVIWRRPK